MISFFKELPTGTVATDRQPEFYELSYLMDTHDPLHACVVFYYEGDEVEVVPVVELVKLPGYYYLFSDKIHPGLVKVSAGRAVRVVTANKEYRVAFMNKSL